MTKFPVAAGIALALVAGSALAADLPSRKGPPPAYIPPPPSFSWTGLYGGVNIGYGFGAGGSDQGAVSYLPGSVWAGNSVGVWGNNSGLNISGVTGGGQVGYNYQFNPWLVLGVEADIQAADINSNRNFGGVPVGANAPTTLIGLSAFHGVDWWGTVRGRIGFTPFMPNLMIYGTGGFAYGQGSHNVSVGVINIPTASGAWGVADTYSTQTGWTAGGGVEWSPLSFPTWSLKVEYLYTDLGRASGSMAGLGFVGSAVTPGPFVANNSAPTQFHSVRAGLNWHFNPFASAPVVAKY